VLVSSGVSAQGAFVSSGISAQGERRCL